jgi:hypothetical protein
MWVSGSYTNISLDLKTLIPLGFDAGFELATCAIINGEFSIINNEFDLNKTTLEIVKHARVVRVSQIIDRGLNRKSMQSLVINTEYPPFILMLHYKYPHSIKI